VQSVRKHHSEGTCSYVNPLKCVEPPLHNAGRGNLDLSMKISPAIPSTALEPTCVQESHKEKQTTTSSVAADALNATLKKDELSKKELTPTLQRLLDHGGVLKQPGGKQHVFFLEMEGHPAGHLHECFKDKWSTSHSSYLRRAENERARKQNLVPHGWNIKEVHSSLFASTYGAVRLRCTFEKATVPGTQTELPRRVAELYKALNDAGKADASIPKAVAKAAALIQKKTSPHGKTQSKVMPVGEVSSIIKTGEVWTYIVNDDIKIAVPAPKEGETVNYRDETVFILAHGLDMKPDAPGSLAKLPEDTTVALYGPPSRILMTQVVKDMDEHRLYATLRAENGVEHVNLIAPEAKKSTNISEVSGTLKPGQLRNLRLKKFARLGEAPPGAVTGQADYASYLRDRHDKRSMDFMVNRTKKCVVTIRKGRNPSLAQILDALSKAGFEFGTVIPVACRADLELIAKNSLKPYTTSDNPTAKEVEENALSAPHLVAENGDLLPYSEENLGKARRIPTQKIGEDGQVVIGDDANPSPDIYPAKYK